MAAVLTGIYSKPSLEMKKAHCVYELTANIAAGCTKMMATDNGESFRVGLPLK